jgi:hypothetical protein
MGPCSAARSERRGGAFRIDATTVHKKGPCVVARVESRGGGFRLSTRGDHNPGSQSGSHLDALKIVGTAPILTFVKKRNSTSKCHTGLVAQGEKEQGACISTTGPCSDARGERRGGAFRIDATTADKKGRVWSHGSKGGAGPFVTTTSYADALQEQWNAAQRILSRPHADEAEYWSCAASSRLARRRT